MFKKKKYNVRNIIFTLTRYDGTSIRVEITGKLVRKKFLFFSWYVPESANPDRIVSEWGKSGFIRVDTRDFINLDTIEGISYKTAPHEIER